MTNVLLNKPALETLTSFSKACSERNILIDNQDFTLAHVSESQLFSRHEAHNGQLLQAHDYELTNLEPSWDCVLRLATLIIIKHKRARPDAVLKDIAGAKALHLAAECLEALQLINDDATLDDSDTITSSKSLSFDFAAHGLDSSHFATGARSTYAIPSGGTKLYLLPAFRSLFDDYVDAGSLSDDYGRNKVIDECLPC